MGRDVVIRQLRDGDIERVIAAMRPEVVREIEATGETPLEAAQRSVLASTHAMYGEGGGRPLALFGVTPLSLLSGVGSPWLLTTVHVDDYRVSFWRASKKWVGAMHAIYPRLFNVVDPRYPAALSYLRRLGFEVVADAEVTDRNGAKTTFVAVERKV